MAIAMCRSLARPNSLDRFRAGGATQAVQVQTETASVEVAEAAAAQHLEAEGGDLGDYFEYNVKLKITIGKNQSALVPILRRASMPRRSRCGTKS